MSTYSYRDLRVWREAMRLARTCHELTRTFPDDERFGLTSQIRRAASSVPANIAEGNGRFTRPDYVRHLSIANGSLRELETHVMLARAFDYLTREQCDRCLVDCWSVSRKLIALAKALRTVPRASSRAQRLLPARAARPTPGRACGPTPGGAAALLPDA